MFGFEQAFICQFFLKLAEGQFQSAHALRDELLDNHLVEDGRQLAEVRRSVMVGTLFGRNENELANKIKQYSSRLSNQVTVEELRQRGFVVGTPEMIREQIKHYKHAGAQCIMLQWLDLDDLDGLASLGEALL